MRVMDLTNACVWLALGLSAALSLSSARAQDSQRSIPPASQPGRGVGRGHGAPGLAPGRARTEDFIHSLFGLEPEDQGPLQPGEEEKLLAFTRDHTPRLYRAMEGLRQRNPARFQERLTEHAPRLRHLQRVYEHSPRIGTIIQKYAENLFEIERMAAILRRAADGTAGRERDVQALRNLVAGNVRLESDALDALAGELEEDREQRIERRVAGLTSADADLSAAPGKLREVVADYHAATTDAERESHRQTIRAWAERQNSVEVGALRERVARMRQQAAQQVDARMDRLLEARPPRSEKNADVP